jgi:diguanylate cyclase
MNQPIQGPPSDISIEHWDVLFDAVEARLRLMVDDRLDGALAQTASRIRTGVLESVEALDLLHVALRHERAQHDPAPAQAGTDSGVRVRDAAANEALNSLPSHRSFCERLDDTLARSVSPHPVLAVMHLDLDEFRTIRESLGLQVGEDLLRIVAARLTRALRTDDVVSHAVNDGFVCLLVDAPSGREQLCRLACRLFDVVTAPITLGACSFTVRPSIGMAIWPGHGATAVALLDSAQSAVSLARRYQLGYAFVDQRGPQADQYLAVGGQGALA